MVHRGIPQNITDPRPGFYTLRLVRRGWAVPARIWKHLRPREGDPEGAFFFTCSINGDAMPGEWKPEDLEAHWANWLTAEGESPIIKIMARGEECTEDEYNFRLEMKAWAVANSPEHPAARPDKPIDVRLLPASDDF